MLEASWVESKKDCSNPFQATTSNANPKQPYSHCKAYGHDTDHYFMFHPRVVTRSILNGKCEEVPKFWQRPEGERCHQ